MLKQDVIPESERIRATCQIKAFKFRTKQVVPIHSCEPIGICETKSAISRTAKSCSSYNDLFLDG
jgi:hypothetical protein